MQSVRTAVVVIGFVVTAVGITVRNGNLTFGFGPAILTGFGVFFLTVTITAGVGTYSITEYKNRLTDAERARLERRTPPTSGQRGELVRIYYSWMETLDQQLTEQVAYLTVTLFTLVLGVLTLLSAATLVVVENGSLFDGLPKLLRPFLKIITAILVFSVSLLATRLSIKEMNVQT